MIIREPLNNPVRSAFQFVQPQIVFALNATTLRSKWQWPKRRSAIQCHARAAQEAPERSRRACLSQRHVLRRHL